MKAALAGAAFFFTAGWAAADPVAPSVLVPALDVYVDAVVAGHDAALGCAPPSSRSRNAEDWDQARAIFIATLWASGFPADFVRNADTRLATATPLASCDPADNGEFPGVEQDGWQKTLGYALSGMDLTPIAELVPAAAWMEIKQTIADDMPRQARMLACIAVVYPTVLPVAIHDWDEMIGKAAAKLVDAGVPRDELTAALAPAEANALWHRAPADKVAALAADCQADETWQDRFSSFEFYGISATVDKLLPQPADDSDQ